MGERILIIGMPGSGKGTQAELFLKYGFKHISTGDVIRRAFQEKNKLILPYQGKIESGGFLPDELIFDLVQDEVGKTEKYILDGAVRTIGQAEYVLEKNLIDKVIYFSLPEDVAVKRLLNRSSDRVDDNIEAIKVRMKVYYEKTESIINYLRKNFEFIEVDGSKSVEEIHNEVVSKLGIKE